jgi:hypothetical protein
VSRTHRMVPVGSVAAAAVVLAMVVLAAGCGVTSDDSFKEFGDDELARELVETTTTSTTIAATTTTTEPAETGTVSTIPATIVQTQQVDVYYVIGDKLQSQSVALASQVSPEQVVARLVDGPEPGTASVGLRSVVPNDLVVDFTEERGVLTIDLRGAVLDRMLERDKPLAIAQLALSLSRTILGIGQIRFTRDGVATGVPVPARDGEVSEPGEGLVFDDFAGLLATTSPLTATATTSTTTTTTTVPPVETAPLSSTPAGTVPPGG